MKLKKLSLSSACQVFKCLSEDARVRILHLLYKKKQLCISDLCQILDFTQTKTSRHLIYLKNAGLVSSKKINQWTYYYIREELIDFIETLLSYMERDTTLLKDIDLYQTMYSNRELAAFHLENPTTSFHSK